MEEKNTRESQGLSLLKKGQKGLFAVIFSRLGIIVLLFLLQLFLLFAIARWFSQFLAHLYALSIVMDIIMVPVLLNSRLDPTAQITWLMVIMIMPVFGALLPVLCRAGLIDRQTPKKITW